MSPRDRHPDKDVQKALEAAEADGALVEARHGRGHAWGRIRCGRGGHQGCALMIWSTPKNPHGHARLIRNLMRKCPHPRPEPEVTHEPTGAQRHSHD